MCSDPCKEKHINDLYYYIFVTHYPSTKDCIITHVCTHVYLFCIKSAFFIKTHLRTTTLCTVPFLEREGSKASQPTGNLINVLGVHKSELGEISVVLLRGRHSCLAALCGRAMAYTRHL